MLRKLNISRTGIRGMGASRIGDALINNHYISEVRVPHTATCLRLGSLPRGRLVTATVAASRCGVAERWWMGV